MSDSQYEFTVPNYDLAKTVECGQFFRWDKLENQDGYRLVSGDSMCIARKIGDKLCIFAVNEPNAGYWRNFFGIDFFNEQYSKLEFIMNSTPYLRQVWEVSRGTWLLNQNAWEVLLWGLISQRNNIPRIKQCVSYLCKNFGKKFDGYFGYPNPSKIVESNLTYASLGYRERYVRGAARQVSDHSFKLELLTPDRVSMKTALQHLMRLEGVGIKVSSCIALYGLGHTDAFPVDIWIERAMDEGAITHNDIESYGKLAGLVQLQLYYYMLHR